MENPMKQEIDEIIAALSAEFPRDQIYFRPGPTTKDKTKAKPLAYIDARIVQDRLDDVCVWTNTFDHGPGGRVTCNINIILASGKMLPRSDGAGETDIEGEKGIFSGAFKRAAVKWGVGRYLYDMDCPWLECEFNEFGRFVKWKQDPWKAMGIGPDKAKEGLQQARDDHAKEQLDDGKAVEWLEGLKASINDKATMEAKKAIWASSEKNRDALAERFPTLSKSLDAWWAHEQSLWADMEEFK